MTADSGSTGRVGAQTKISTAPASRWPLRWGSFVCLLLVVSACGGAFGTPGPRTLPPTVVSAPLQTPAQWPFAFETYGCSALDELAAVAIVADRVVDEIGGGSVALGLDGAQEIDERLGRAREYVDQVPEWAPGTRFVDLLRAAVRHYREGNAALRTASVTDTALITEASAALSRGNASVRKTEDALVQLEETTGFAC